MNGRVALGAAVGTALIGGAIGAMTDGKPLTAVLGAAIGGALGTFAPSAYDAVVARRRAPLAPRLAPMDTEETG